MKRAKTDHGNHQSTNGDVTQSSATVITQQPVIQSTAAADVMPAYTYTPTWPGYAVRMSRAGLSNVHSVHVHRRPHHKANVKTVKSIN